MKNYEEFLNDKNYTDFNPLTFGCATCPKGKAINLSERHYCLIHYVTSGKGILYIYDTSYEVTEGQLFIIPQGTPNKYIADATTPWSYIWIGFTGKLADSFSSLPPVINFPFSIFQEMQQVSTIQSMKSEYLIGKLFEIYRILFSNNESIDIADKIKNFIDSNYMFSDVTVEKIARSLHMNRSYLTRRYKQKTGTNIQDYLIQTRLNRACELLKQGVSVHETANMVGYLDVFNFSKIFKRRLGISPDSYRTTRLKID